METPDLLQPPKHLKLVVAGSCPQSSLFQNAAVRISPSKRVLEVSSILLHYCSSHCVYTFNGQIDGKGIVRLIAGTSLVFNASHAQFKEMLYEHNTVKLVSR